MGNFKNIFYISILLWQIFAFELFAQVPTSAKSRSEEDSLRALIANAQSDSEKLELNLKMSEILTDYAPEKAEPYLQAVNKLTQSDTMSGERVKYYIFRGVQKLREGKFEPASKFFMLALRKAEAIDSTHLAKRALNDLAIVNLNLGFLEKGIKYLEQLVKIAREEKNKKDETIFLLNLSLAYANNRQFKKAEKGLLYLLKNTDDKFYIAVANNSLSKNYNSTGEFRKAIYYGKKAAKIAHNLGRPHLETEALINYGNALRELRRFEEAKKVMFRVSKLARQYKSDYQYMNSLGNLSLLYEDLKNYPKALEYFKKYSALRDSLMNEKVAKQINELQIKYETEKKDKELKLKDATIKEKNLKLTFLIFGLAVFILFSTTLLIMYKKKNKAYRELVRKNMELVQEGLLLKKRKETKSESTESGSYALAPERKKELVKKLEYLTKEEKVFLQKDFTLGSLAHMMGVNSKYISEIIHEEFNCHFNDFVNKLRIQEAARLLADTNYENITIEGISNLVGFRSKSVFNIAFKKIMGVTPSFYIKTSRSLGDNG
jgi:YesN/AraC family two-component response regulator